jgi:hypothetical protein
MRDNTCTLAEIKASQCEFLPVDDRQMLRPLAVFYATHPDWEPRSV